MPVTVAVIGGANTDIFGLAGAAVRAGDSAPGTVRISPGGVGRNVAENLARLGCDVRLVTSVGDGVDSEALVAECRHLGIDVRVVPAPGLPCPRYVCIVDEQGRPVAGVSDMRAVERLVPDAIDQFRPAVDGADVVVLDANLPEATIAWACEQWRDRPVMADVVSVAKATRIAGCLDRLHTVKANAVEAATILGAAPGDLEGAAEGLLSRGAQRVVLTDGADGGLFAAGAERVRFKAIPARVANATGAGDAFMAGVAYGTAAGFDLKRMLAFAAAMAAFALESERTVSEAIDLASVLRRADEVMS
ncbi:MAG: carbohydrate kinase family protein [Anaerosomatales bacterium]|nr:carbohydrate kinase family protein [Anaerosomatales bacterium]